jgi:hypothetical protein
MHLRQVTKFCPAQWEGKTSAGETLYCRHRFGELIIRIGVDFQNDSLGTLVYKSSVGGPLDGDMTTEELVPHLHKAGIN